MRHITMRKFTFMLLFILYIDMCVGVNYAYFTSAYSAITPSDDTEYLDVGETEYKESMVTSVLKLEPTYFWSSTGLFKSLTPNFPNGGCVSDIDGDKILNENDVDYDGDGVSNTQEYDNKQKLKTELTPSGTYTGGHYVDVPSQYDNVIVTNTQFISDDILYVDQYQNERSPIEFNALPTGIVLPSGGQIRVDTGTPVINTKQIIYYPNPSKGSDFTGAKYHIYRASFPFEFSFQVSTLFDYQHVNPFGTTGYQYDEELCVARYYLGDDLNSQQNNGYRVDAGIHASDYLGDGAPKIPNVDSNYFYEVDGSVHNPYQKNVDSDGWINYNDGNNGFKTSYDYGAIQGVFMPNIKLGDPSGNADKDFASIKNAMIPYETTPAVDVGNFGVSFRAKLDPFLLGNVELYTKDDGTTIKKTDTKIEITSVQMLEVDPNGNPTDQYGYLGELTAETLAQYYKDDTPENREGANLAENDDPSTEKQPTNGILGSSVEFKTADTPLSSTYSLSDQYGGDISFSLGQPKLYSRDLMKYQIDFDTQEQENTLQLTDWNVELSGFHLTPRVQLVKKVSLIDYVEKWYDKDVDEWELFQDRSRLIEMHDLAGWQVVNTWLEQRVRIWVDIYAQVPIDQNFKGQSGDAEDQSNLGDPNNPIGMRIWDTSNYGTLEAEVIVTHPLNDLGNVVDLLLNQWWIILIIIVALLAIVIAVAVTIKNSFSKGGSKSFDTDQLIKLQLQMNLMQQYNAGQFQGNEGYEEYAKKLKSLKNL